MIRNPNVSKVMGGNVYAIEHDRENILTYDDYFCHIESEIRKSATTDSILSTIETYLDKIESKDNNNQFDLAMYLYLIRVYNEVEHHSTDLATTLTTAMTMIEVEKERNKQLALSREIAESYKFMS